MAKTPKIRPSASETLLLRLDALSFSHPHLRSVSASTTPTARPQVMLCRKLSSQLSQRIIESSGLFGSRGLLGLRRVWVEVNGVDEAPIAGLT